MKISCIIPTYNEASRIENVLKIVLPHPMVDEVIIVDDGSTDTTQEILQKIMETYDKAIVIRHPQNKGKSAAISTGIYRARGELCMFIDADLFGLTEKNITDLITPVLQGSADVAISLRGNSPYLWRLINLDYISGERVIPRAFLQDIVDVFTTIPKFGLESYMNRHMIQKRYRIKIITWMNVGSPFKYIKKRSMIKGIIAEAKMILDIFRTITIFGPIYQIIKIKQLEVK